MPLILDLAAEHVPATLLRQQRLARLVGDRTLDLDLASATVTFGEDLTAGVQVVGSVTDAARQFVWAWAADDPSLPADAVRGVTALCDYGRTHVVAEFTEAAWHTDDVDPFLLAAIARGWCGAQALYRTPAPGGAVYLLLDGLDLPAPDAHQVVQALTTGIALAPVDHRQAAMALFADNGFAVTGLDEMVVATVGSALVNVTFTAEGRVDDVGVTHL